MLALLLAGWTVSPCAQLPSESALRAAFLYKFAQFTDWPTDHLAPAGPLHFCIADPDVAEALEATVAGRSIGQHVLMVTRVKTDEILNACEVLYAGTLDVKRFIPLLASLKGFSVLSVGDAPRFIGEGGIVRLFMENGKMRFVINVGAATRANLHLHSQLLALATVVRVPAPVTPSRLPANIQRPGLAGIVKD